MWRPSLPPYAGYQAPGLWSSCSAWFSGGVGTRKPALASSHPLPREPGALTQAPLAFVPWGPSLNFSSIPSASDASAAHSVSALDSDRLIGLMQVLECGKGRVYIRGPRLVAPWLHPLGHLVDMSWRLEQGVRLLQASLCSPVQRGQKSHLPGLGWQCNALRAPSART